MSRCSNCGKTNRGGSLFCQDCGHKLEEAIGMVPRKSRPGFAVVDGSACPSCGSPNPSGMNFCKICGAALGGRTKVPVSPSNVLAAVPILVCPACSKSTPSGFAFCQNCGQRMASQALKAASPIAEVVPTPPAGVRPAAALAATMSADGSLGLAAASASPRPAPASLPQSGPARGHLVVVSRDGTDGERFPLVGEHCDVGRAEGQIAFADDPYMAARQARFSFEGGRLTVRPLDLVNGIYLRLRAAWDLGAGDQFIIGKELLRFEPLSLEDRESPILLEHGVRLFGSPPREAWGRLREITGAGTTRDLWHLHRAEMVLGREEGDITFPEDEFMSRCHAVLRKTSAKARLEDLGSSNGTFIRLRRERELEPGDAIRLGDQLLRFDP